MIVLARVREIAVRASAITASTRRSASRPGQPGRRGYELDQISTII